MNYKLPLTLPARFIFFFAVFFIEAAIGLYDEGTGTSLWSLTVIIVNLLTLADLQIVSAYNDMDLPQLINYKKGQTDRKKAVPLIIGFVLLGMGGMYLAGLLCYGTIMPKVSLQLMAPVPLILVLINIIALPITTTLAEDGLYLGCGVGQIENKYAAVIIPALLYAAQHCIIPLIADPVYMLYRFLSFLPLTFLFCIYYRRKKDPVPIMISHFILDLATALGILYTSIVPGGYEQMQAMTG